MLQLQISTGGLRIWIAGALAFAVACGSSRKLTPTETVVEIDAESEVQTRTASLHVTVDGASSSKSSALVNRLDETVKPIKFPKRVAIVPLDGDAQRTFVLTATALDGDMQVVAQARLISGYVAGQIRYPKLLLEASCIDITCGSSETCKGGACVAAAVKAPSLPTTAPKSPGPTANHDAGSDSGARGTGGSSGEGAAGTNSTQHGTGGTNLGSGGTGGSNTGSGGSVGADAGPTPGVWDSTNWDQSVWQ